MLILPSTTDKVQLITDSAATLDVIAHYADVNNGAPPIPQAFGRQVTAISSAATTDILAAPSGANVRNMEECTIRNKHASLSVNVTVQYNANGTLYELYKLTLQPGETLEYNRGIGWLRLANVGVPQTNVSTADQTLSSADTYLTGSAILIPTSRPIAVGTILTWDLFFTKTGAGIATPIFNVRFGTAGTTSDSGRITFTGVAQTGVIDTAQVTIKVVIRGPIGASCIAQGGLSLHHNLSATGFANIPHDTLSVASSGFDCTTAGMIVGVSANPGASGVWTATLVTAKVENI